MREIFIWIGIVIFSLVVSGIPWILRARELRKKPQRPIILGRVMPGSIVDDTEGRQWRIEPTRPWPRS